MMFILNRIVLVLNGIGLLLLLVSYASPYVSPELFWPVSFLGLAYPVLVIVNLLFVLYWIAVFKLKFMYSLVAIALGYSFLPAYIQFKAKKSTETEHTITLMNFNMKYFGAYEEDQKLKEPDRFFEIFDKVNADVLCYQEYKELGTPKDRDMFKRMAKKLAKYPYSCNTYPPLKDRRNFNADRMVIFSKFPIIHSGKIESMEGSNNFTVYADVVAYGDTIRVIDTHLQSIRFDNPDYQAINKLSFSNDSAYTTISKKLKIAFIMRAKQAEALRDFLEQSPYKVILSGDFNDSPTSYAYRTVRGNMKDAFIEAGSGLGRTYVGAMPSFRIDYILHDPSFSSYNYYARAFEFSDHKMISCRIKIK
jgi:endonuclease/exonuclease/phosphatase family metal-dependent hydrolase